MNDFHYYTFPSFQNIVSSKKKKISFCMQNEIFISNHLNLYPYFRANL
jgi:hypothetical protein